MSIHNTDECDLESPFHMLDGFLLKEIISFVGPNQYFFVASIHTKFYNAYRDTFPQQTTTFLNASTIEHAKFCWEEGAKNTEEYQVMLCHSAAAHGNIPALQYLHSMKCKWDARTCSKAARIGHLHVLQWCRKHGCSWNEHTCSEAARNGHLHVLQWCRKHGCSCNEHTCSEAARNGHLHILQWCHDNGCPGDEWTCAKAAEMLPKPPVEPRQKGQVAVGMEIKGRNYEEIAADRQR